MHDKIHDYLARLESLMMFRILLGDEVIRKFSVLLHACSDKKHDLTAFIVAYSNFFAELITYQTQNGSLKTCSPGEYVVNRIMYGETPFSKMAEQVDYNSLPQYVIRAAESDLSTLGVISSVSSDDIKKVWLDGTAHDNASAVINLPEWESGISDNPIFSPDKPWGECVKALADFFRKNGSGMFACYKGFIWERFDRKGFLRGIASPDPVRLDDFIGYELQRKQVVENTLQFLNGFEANNMLLYGDRGTGKSSTVKALLNEYHAKGLRMIEMPKQLLSDFHEVLRIVQGSPLKFIIFVDDLAFEDDEDSYTSLKAVLEGGLESKPRNLVIYATTNRRHLIKERFSERRGLASASPNDEVHAADTMQEKLSLADRFGITVTFESPDQDKYLEIVDGLAEKRGLAVSKEILHREAIRWEMWYNGRSPRTALQFINWLEGQKGMP